MIDLSGVGALVSALTGLLVAAGSIVLQRQRKSVVDVDDMESELEVRTDQYQAALRHIRLMEDDRANRGLDAYPRPPELAAGYFQERQARRKGGKRDVAGEQPAAG